MKLPKGWREMGPGPELDALVAEAMGWRRITLEESALEFCWSGGTHVWVHPTGGLRCEACDGFPDYADANHALEAAEAVGLFRGGEGEGEWVCWFQGRWRVYAFNPIELCAYCGHYSSDEIATGTTFAHALSLAVLAVVEGRER